ncbi:MAG: hypothetical protein AAGD32_15590 [Planctomycetota bacterium]
MSLADLPTTVAPDDAPAKHAVYLMTDADDRPVQLLAVKNLRASLRNRLSEKEGKAVDLSTVVKDVHYRPVSSTFEADLVWLEAARRHFPDRYAGWLGFRTAWWVHVNPDTTYPRFTKTTDPTLSTGIYVGPIGDKHDAQKLVHKVEALFDLCRDYGVLQKAPAGACNWKQMGRCVGPCDGTITLEQYGKIVADAAEALAVPELATAKLQGEMLAASGAMDFEKAAAVKARIDDIAKLRKHPYKFIAPMTRFRWLAVMPGPRKGTAKLFTAIPTQFDVAGVIDDPKQASALLRHLLETPDPERPTDAAGLERMSLFTHHQTIAKAKQEGVFLRLDEFDDRALRNAFKKVAAREVAESDDEGATREVS